jgi:hypothetical protein
VGTIGHDFTLSRKSDFFAFKHLFDLEKAKVFADESNER